mgnify:CR=1 FL=1
MPDFGLSVGGGSDRSDGDSELVGGFGDEFDEGALEEMRSAAGDLDGDGSAEIVAYGSDGATLAFTRKNGQWGLLWKAAYPAGPCE